MIRVSFYQTKSENLSINILFEIVKQHLPRSIRFSTEYFSYGGRSVPSRVSDIASVALKSRKQVNHVIGDFNYAVLLMPGASTVLTIHDLYRLYVHESSPFKSFFFKWLWLRLPVYKAGVVTAISQYTKDEILKYANCQPDKIKVIYNCIWPDFKPVSKIFNKTKPVLLQVGTRQNKNLDRLIQAIAGISCKLDIIGEPGAETLRLLAQHKIEYSWATNLSTVAVIEKYVDCDMLVFVSTFEGFGMPIIEANAVERAVVTSSISAMPEIAGDAACLVDPFDIASIREGIKKVIEDDEYREALVVAGRKNKLRFEAEIIANQYAQLYKEVAESSKTFLND